MITYSNNTDTVRNLDRFLENFYVTQSYQTGKKRIKTAIGKILKPLIYQLGKYIC